MAPILAIPSLLAFSEELLEYGLYLATMVRVRLIKGHHVDEDDMAFVHEEVAEEIEGFGFADPKADVG